MRTTIMALGAVALVAGSIGRVAAKEPGQGGNGKSLAAARKTPAAGKKLFIDVHRLGPGKVTPADVAGAHQRDLAVGAKRGDVRYLNYWYNTATGTVMCLVEAPNAEAALAVHKEAHGLMPESIEEVEAGQ
jgi:hypothetical protein